MGNSDGRLRSLDSFLLFMTTIFGLFFSLISALLAQREIAYGFFPLLIIGLVIPIYIGYVRGAIILDTIEERVRGWIYFLYGIIVYISATALWVVNKLMVTANTEFEIASELLMFIGFFLISYFLGVGKLRRWFSRTVFTLFNRERTKLTAKIYRDTGRSAFYLGVFLYIAFTASITHAFDMATATIILIVISFGSVDFILNEHIIRKWIKLLQFSEFIELEYRSAKFFIPIWIGETSRFVGLLAIAIFLVVYSWIGVLAKIGLVLIIMVSMILVLLSYEGSQTIYVKKKEGMSKDMEEDLTKLLAKMKVKAL